MKRSHICGYHVWLFGDKTWHRTLKGAIHKSRSAENYCNGEHNQIIECATGRHLVSWDRSENREIYNGTWK